MTNKSPFGLVHGIIAIVLIIAAIGYWVIWPYYSR